MPVMRVVTEAEEEVLRLARAWRRFSHTAALLDAVRALQADEDLVADGAGRDVRSAVRLDESPVR